MPRPIRFIPDKSLVEVTTRTLQGRLLLKPSPELTDIILGIIGKAQERYAMTIHAFVFLSTHAHFLLSPSYPGQLALFMQFVNANVAKEAGRLHHWRERFWSRRYRAIVVADESAAHARIRYILAHGAKEGLLASPKAWPGPNCIAALTTGARLQGTWFDRTKEFLARQRGQQPKPKQFAHAHTIELSPLPCLRSITADQRQAHYRRVLKDIQDQANADNLAKGRTPMTVANILAQDPHSKPSTTARSPAPFVHASDRSERMKFRAAYRAFVDAFRAGALRLRDHASVIRDMFPRRAFPPQLPFKEQAEQA
jgi:hypothetical protein